MSLIKVVQEYVNRIVAVPGMKVLMLDKGTVGTKSL
jgi:hypothetical protein